MASKTLVVLGVLFATAILLSSEVAAREVAEQQEAAANSVGVVNQKEYNGPIVTGGADSKHCMHGCCKMGCHGMCCKCCMTADEIPEAHESMPEPTYRVGFVNQKEYNGPIVTGGVDSKHCMHGCCKMGCHGMCCKCCKTADEIPEAPEPTY